jgi:hypothetical protein
MIGQGCGLLYNVQWYVKLKYEKRLQRVDDPKRLVYHSIPNLKCSILSQPDATHLGYDLWERFVAT